MIAFQDLKAVLKTSIGWERKLKDFYDVAEYALKSQESRQIIAILRDKLAAKLEILENINLDRHGKTAWIQFAPDYKDEDLIPIQQIGRNSAPREIISQILETETRLKDFYASICSDLISRSQKEVFDSLVKFKENQISEIDNLLNSSDLSI